MAARRKALVGNGLILENAEGQSRAEPALRQGHEVHGRADEDFARTRRDQPIAR